MQEHGLNQMSKREIREQLARDAQQWVKENGEPELIAGKLSRREEKYWGVDTKRKARVSEREEHYQQWLGEIAEEFPIEAH